MAQTTLAIMISMTAVVDSANASNALRAGETTKTITDFEVLSLMCMVTHYPNNHPPSSYSRRTHQRHYY
jgi:hypothetical protein